MANGKNRIAKKFNIVIALIKILGYGGAILVTLGCIIGCIIASIASEMILVGFIVGILLGLIIALGTWFSCLTYEAIAETLQLLEDIKNK